MDVVGNLKSHFTVEKLTNNMSESSVAAMAAKTIDPCKQFVEGGTTSVLTSAEISVQQVWDVGLNTADSLKSTALNGVNSAVSGVAGSVGSVAGNLMGAADIFQSDFRKDIVIVATSELIRDLQKMVSDALIKIMTPPTLGDITSKAQKYFLENVDDPNTVLSRIMKSSEDDLEDDNSISLNKSLGAINDTVAGGVKALNDKVSQYTNLINEKISMITEFASYGPEYMAEQIDKITSDIREDCEKFISKNTKEIEETKQKSIDKLAEKTGKFLAKKVNKATEKATKKQTDDVQNKIEDAKTKVKTAASEAIEKIKAMVGL